MAIVADLRDCNINSIKELAQAICKSGKDRIKFSNPQDALKVYFKLKEKSSSSSLSFADKGVVTSASDLFRNKAVAAFRKNGMIKIANPTDTDLSRMIKKTP